MVISVSLFRESGRVIENRAVAHGIFVTTFETPQIARATHPGQFVAMAPLHPSSILNRPMAVYDIDGERGIVSVGYHVIGDNTRLYGTLKEGDTLTLTGPFGSRYPFDVSFDHYVLVGGGIGITSLHLMGKFFHDKGKTVTTFIGARAKDLIACREDFLKFGTVNIATDDGSVGYHGFIHELLKKELNALKGKKVQVIYCGPRVMMEACAQVCDEAGVAHLAVMEEMMACGFGVCVACVAQEGEALKKVCIEGPVFNGARINWTREQTSAVHE